MWAGLVLVACGSGEGVPGTSDDSIGQAREAMFDATLVPPPASAATGVVRITTTWPSSNGAIGECTGVLLTNRWVLTANHCFCNGQVTPVSNVVVSSYGENYTTNALYPLYTTTAAQIINHPSADVALIQLAETLPLPAPPAIYTGNGTDLPGQTATAYGYGDYTTAVTSGAEMGAGEDLRTMTLAIDFNATTAANTEIVDCGTKSAFSFPATGPWGQGVPGADLTLHPRTAPGDSGGPLFIGPASSPTLVAVAHGTEPTNNGNRDAYVGIWTVRDWIAQQTGVPKRSACVTPLPNSTSSTGRPAVAFGPDGALHVAAVQSNNTIAHWKLAGATITKLPAVTGASAPTTDAVGIGLESAAAPGQPLKLGLAYRDSTSHALKYARWSATTGWSSIVTLPTAVLAAGPAMTSGGPVALMQTNDRVYVTFFDPTAGAFGGLYRPATTAPFADPNRRISVAYEPAFGGITIMGYRTTADAWVQATGNSSISGYFGTPTSVSTSWVSAMLAYTSGQRATVVTTQATSFPTQADYTSFNGANYAWGGNAEQVFGEPGVAQIGTEIVEVVTNLDGSLYVTRSEDCFANDF